MPDQDALPSLLARAHDLIPDARQGLPDAAFQFVLKTVPMVNVDLLVRDDAGRLLLAWREDPFGTGWHVPGGIIRYREHWDQRIAAVARLELGATVSHGPAPVHLEQFFYERGHFISLLFECRLLSPPPPDRFRRPDDLAWFASMPSDMYPCQRIYERFFG